MIAKISEKDLEKLNKISDFIHKLFPYNNGRYKISYLTIYIKEIGKEPMCMVQAYVVFNDILIDLKSSDTNQSEASNEEVVDG
jgi:hypothetical protein